MKFDAIRQSLIRLAKEGKIERCAQGVYYIPSETALGKSKISANKSTKESIFVMRRISMDSILD